MEKVRLAIVGLGRRGTGLIKAIFTENERCEIVAICDLYRDRVDDTAELIKEKTDRVVPIQTTDFNELLAKKNEIDAICVSASWECHIELAIASMKAGIPVAIEVGGAYSVEDCFDLVRTQVETGTKFMFLENCCYGRVELAVLNMVRQGLFGEISHCEGGYEHDLRNQVLLGEENRHYRLRNYIARNCDNYPMHAFGPISKILNINNGNRMLYLTSMASKAVGLNDYASLHPDLYQSKYVTQKFNQGDVIRTNIMCADGTTVSLMLNTTSARPYSRNFSVQGTRACYFEDGMFFHFDAEHGKKDMEKPVNYLNNQNEWLEKYDHPIWEKFLSDGVRGGHGGMDWLLFEAFFDYIIDGGKSPIDVYDAAAWMSITPLSAKSIELGSMPVEVPDFTLIK
ncbi:MAG: Gfo/Idh/MocA family oxidoreductase [Clostridia bacterium]|nr:Gfo/Idh/MocA family oxidoreductase [Clostridia bacterium]